MEVPASNIVDGVVKCWRQLVERELSSKGVSIESIFDLDDLSNLPGVFSSFPKVRKACVPQALSVSSRKNSKYIPTGC